MQTPWADCPPRPICGHLQGSDQGWAAGESNGGTASSVSGFKAPSPRAIVGTPSPNSLVKFINAAGDLSNSIVVDNGSNVGIGTVSPSSPLTVVGNGVSPLGTANFFRSDLGGRFSHIQYGASGDWYVRSSLSSGRVILQDTGGNVGIGTGTPASKLDVAGDINFTGIIRYAGFPFVRTGPGNTAIGANTLNNN